MMLATNDLTFGLVTPVLAYLMSCVGGFIGLRCTTRAYAYRGAARIRWPQAMQCASPGTVSVFNSNIGHFDPRSAISKQNRSASTSTAAGATAGRFSLHHSTTTLPKWTPLAW